MPCNCDHLHPTDKETERKKLTQLLIGFMIQTGDCPSSQLIAQANHVYAEGPASFETMTESLCNKVRGLDAWKRDKLLLSVRDFSGDPLAAWWFKHQEQDAKINEPA